MNQHLSQIESLGDLPELPTDDGGGSMRRGTPEYGRASLALFLAGFSTFSLLWCAQPLLPALARHFSLSAATSSLAVSLTTGALAAAIVVAGALSQLVSRRGLMFASMTGAATLNLLAAFAPDWSLLLLARLLQGIVLGGVPAVAVAYLAEEMHPSDMARAIGLYVAGTAFGGMIGRVAMGAIADLSSWRMAMGVIGAVDLVAAIGFFRLLPPSRNFVVQRGLNLRAHGRIWAGHLRRRELLCLFMVGFILTSVFIGLFNYAGFRLSQAPYHLGQAAISALFLTYAFGIVASTYGGGLADRFGPKLPLASGLGMMVVGVVVTLGTSLLLIVLGMVLVTMGFFAAHAVSSGWVGRLAGPAKAQAASLYLLFYYLGATITGWSAGWFWEHGGWLGVAGLTGLLALAGLGIVLSMPAAAPGE